MCRKSRYSSPPAGAAQLALHRQVSGRILPGRKLVYLGIAKHDRSFPDPTERGKEKKVGVGKIIRVFRPFAKKLSRATLLDLRYPARRFAEPYTKGWLRPRTELSKAAIVRPKYENGTPAQKRQIAGFMRNDHDRGGDKEYPWPSRRTPTGCDAIPAGW